ncbi:MAG: hypothetical protein IIA67_11945, partial [Planctomycetes bacterium]|nr:hypothetical protein [Planctomycetota bacterium]
AESLKLARQTCQDTEHQRPAYLDTLAAGHAASGDFAGAVKVAQKAILLAAATGQEQLAEQLRRRLVRYQAGKPFRDKQRAR